MSWQDIIKNDEKIAQLKEMKRMVLSTLDDVSFDYGDLYTGIQTMDDIELKLGNTADGLVEGIDKLREIFENIEKAGMEINDNIQEAKEELESIVNEYKPDDDDSGNMRGRERKYFGGDGQFDYAY